MDEWNSEGLQNTVSGKDKNTSAGRWDASMTVTAFISVAVMSFLTAWLTRGIPSRPFWMLGLCFAAPVAALLISVFLKEKISSSMTPTTSRKSQVLLIWCSILAAAVVGCFCQVANEQADTYEEVLAGESWGDVFIILDKSGSMDYTLSEYKLMREDMTLEEYFAVDRSGEENMDKVAAEAVIDLIGRMDDHARVGLLIDVGWEENNDGNKIVPLVERLLPIGELLPEHRKKLSDLAKSKMLVNENFSRAFEVACDVVKEYDGKDGNLSIVIISDGADSTGKFRAADYVDQLTKRKVKVNYLYVAPDYSEEMRLLTELTGGTSICVEDRMLLLDQMQKMVTVPIIYYVYKDALRTINESLRAKIVTGVLLLLLGLLIGFSLTVMLSVQGQKRFQVILSPIMAVLAFVVLAFGKGVIPIPWVREGIAFSLFGIVLMRRNSAPAHAEDHRSRLVTDRHENKPEKVPAEEW